MLVVRRLHMPKNRKIHQDSSRVMPPLPRAGFPQ